MASLYDAAVGPPSLLRDFAVITGVSAVAPFAARLLRQRVRAASTGWLIAGVISTRMDFKVARSYLYPTRLVCREGEGAGAQS